MVGIGIELVSQCRICRNRDVVGYERSSVVDGTVHVILHCALDVTTYAEGHFSLAVEKEEAWSRWVAEVKVVGVIENRHKLSGFFGAAGGYYGAFGNQECVREFAGFESGSGIDGQD